MQNAIKKIQNVNNVTTIHAWEMRFPSLSAWFNEKKNCKLSSPRWESVMFFQDWQAPHPPKSNGTTNDKIIPTSLYYILCLYYTYILQLSWKTRDHVQLRGNWFYHWMLTIGNPTIVQLYKVNNICVFKTNSNCNFNFFFWAKYFIVVFQLALETSTNCYRTVYLLIHEFRECVGFNYSTFDILNWFESVDYKYRR